LKGLEKYHQRCLRRILKIRWQDCRTNNSFFEETNSTIIEGMIIKHQLRWAGHVVRMPDPRLPKQIMYFQLRNGQRNQGGQFKRYKDVLKANMKKCQIDIIDWENSNSFITLESYIKTLDKSKLNLKLSVEYRYIHKLHT